MERQSCDRDSVFLTAFVCLTSTVVPSINGLPALCRLAAFSWVEGGGRNSLLTSLQLPLLATLHPCGFWSVPVRRQHDLWTSQLRHDRGERFNRYSKRSRMCKIGMFDDPRRFRKQVTWQDLKHCLKRVYVYSETQHMPLGLKREHFKLCKQTDARRLNYTLQHLLLFDSRGILMLILTSI